MVEMLGDPLVRRECKACYSPVGLASKSPAVLSPTCSFLTKNSPPRPSRPFLPYFVACGSIHQAIHLGHTGLLLFPRGEFLPVLGLLHWNVLCQDLVIAFPLHIYSLVRCHLFKEAFQRST